MIIHQLSKVCGILQIMFPIDCVFYNFVVKWPYLFVSAVTVLGLELKPRFPIGTAGLGSTPFQTVCNVHCRLACVTLCVDYSAMRPT